MFATRSVQTQTRTGRLESLTDGTFAIIITLLRAGDSPAGRQHEATLTLGRSLRTRRSQFVSSERRSRRWLSLQEDRVTDW